MIKRRLAWSAVLIPPASALAFATGIAPDPIVGSATFHFWFIAVACLIAGVFAGLMIVAALQVRDVQVFFLALAFLCITCLLFAHGLTTPGAFVPYINPWVGFANSASFLFGAFFLALGTIRWSTRQQQWILARQGHLFISFIVILTIFNLLAVVTAALPAPATHHDEYGYASALATDSLASSLRPLVLLTNPSFNMPVALLSFALLCIAIRYYLRWYRLGSTPLLTGLLAATILLAQAQVILQTTALLHLSWWMHHLLVLAAFVVAGIGLAREYAWSGTLGGVVEGLLLRDSIARIERGYTDVIVALVAAIEARDPYTRGHTQRVAALAVRIGEVLQLSPEQLRILSQAAILHDIGKIGVPDAILNKPGRLTDEEFAIIKEHPDRGYTIIKNIRTLQRELDGVRYHHERLDGSGYPDGLAGDAIPLTARIIAVADVYDAVTSYRAYRGAWSPEKALRYLEAEAGKTLDARCVAGLRTILTRIGVIEDQEPAAQEVNRSEPLLSARADRGDQARDAAPPVARTIR